MRMDRAPHDFPRDDLPYTVEKLKQRGIVARLFYGAGLRKLENDYLNPKHGDVLASQRRYRRYLAGDKRIVAEASWAAWGPLMAAAVTPVLFGITVLVVLVHQALAPYIAAVDQTISRVVGDHGAPASTSTATTGTSPDGSVGNQIQSNAATGSADNSASTATASTQQPYNQAPPVAPPAAAAEANNTEAGDTQDSEIGQDLSMKLQALLAQAEQQFDAGQYQNAAACTEAILEIEPGNVRAQRLHAASLRNLATVAAADATEAQGVSQSPVGPVAQAAPFPVPAPYNPAIAAPCVVGCHRNSPYGRHVGGR